MSPIQRIYPITIIIKKPNFLFQIMIIGVTGKICSGKDTFADYLIDKGFSVICLSDLLRDELRRKKKDITRDNLRSIGNELRAQYGSWILAKRAMEIMKEGKNYVVTSIRNPSEIDFLNKRKDFVLINVHCTQKIRYNRIIKRIGTKVKEDGVFKSFKQFQRFEMIEEDNNPNNQQLHLCAKKAKVVISNNSKKRDFEKRIDKFLTNWEDKLKLKRPTWDDYFLQVAESVSKRSTCDMHKDGCIIVRDKRILSIGYVGAPINHPHCDETGHNIKEGVCQRVTHAEKNAICLAARHGAKLEGAIMYCKVLPCPDCARMIINTGITKVVCKESNQNPKETKDLFAKSKIKLVIN